MSNQMTKAPCAASHPLTGRACMKPRDHVGAHHSSGPGYSHQWETSVDIDQRTPSGERVRLSISEITICAEAADEISRLRAEAERLTAERDEAVEWLGVIRDELVIAGYPGGDRTVALANIRALTARAARLEEALRGVGYSDPDVPGGVCWCAVDDAYPDEHDAECLAARRALNPEGGEHA